jgi:hypothetical protein
MPLEIEYYDRLRDESNVLYHCEINLSGGPGSGFAMLLNINLLKNMAKLEV